CTSDTTATIELNTGAGKDITIEDWEFYVTSGRALSNPLAKVMGPVQNLIFRGVTAGYLGSNTWNPLWIGHSSGVISRLEVAGWNYTAANDSSHPVTLHTAVTDMVFRDSKITNASRAIYQDANF